MSTRAIAFLQRRKVRFSPVAYRHEEKGARFAAEATGFSLSRIVKTLVVKTDSGAFALALVPGDRQLAEKKLARVLGVKRLAMAAPADAERVTGYRTGGISPLATARPLACVMEAGLLDHETVRVNGGRRGLLVELAPADLQRLCGATAAPLCAEADLSRRRPTRQAGPAGDPAGRRPRP